MTAPHANRTIGWRRHAAMVLVMAFACTGAAFAVRWDGFTLVEYLNERGSGVVRYQAATRAKVVALTFDDGPDPRYTPRILRILQRRRIHATFFMEGREVDARPALAERVLAAGNPIGNHTLDHRDLAGLGARMVSREFAGCDCALEQELCIRTHLFRPPHGTWTPVVWRAARRRGDDIVLWSVALEHHEVHTPRAMAARVLRLIRPGGIVLMHDGGGRRENTVQALPLVIDGLRKRGYRFLTVPQLLHIRGDDQLAGPPAG